MDRRAYIVGAGSIGLIGLAGCIASAKPRPPNVPDESLAGGGWELVDERTEEVLHQSIVGQEYTATATTEVYEDAELAAEISERTMGFFDAQIAMYSASRITFDPDMTNLLAGVGRDRIVSEVETDAASQFESELEDAGVESIERVDEDTITVDTGEDASVTTYAGVFPFDSFAFDVNEAESIEIAGGELAIAGQLAVWHHDDSVLVAGGAYPDENYAEAVSEDVTEGISVRVDVDLGLDPIAYRTELFDLIRAVT
ncbi:MAG: hypothetical protein ACQETB_06185 [Halobacteriota archaeon]